MKKVLAVLVLGLLIGCGDGPQDANVTISGDANLNVRDNLTKVRVRVNGTTVFIQQTGLDPFTIALDGTFTGNVTYPDVFNDLTVTDAQRLTPLTPLEVDIINGLQ